jgi:hypothetical protein
MYRKLMLYTLTAAVTAAISVGVVSAQVLTIDELDELTNKNARRIQLNEKAIYDLQMKVNSITTLRSEEEPVKTVSGVFSTSKPEIVSVGQSYMRQCNNRRCTDPNCPNRRNNTIKSIFYSNVLYSPPKTSMAPASSGWKCKNGQCFRIR